MIGIGMNKKDKLNAINSVKVIVTPWEKGFTCGILSDGTTLGMNSKDYELCSTIAKGMCFSANQNPDKIFKLGLEASRLKKIKKNLNYLSLPKENNSNVVDFLQHLRNKKERENN